MSAAAAVTLPMSGLARVSAALAAAALSVPLAFASPVAGCTGPGCDEPDTGSTTVPDLAFRAETTDATNPAGNGGLLLGGAAGAAAAIAAGIYAVRRRSNAPGESTERLSGDRNDGPMTGVAGSLGAVDRTGAPTIATTLPIAPPRDDPGSLVELLDASQRMTASLDSYGVAKIAIAEARKIVSAEGGLIARLTPAGLEAIGSDPASIFATGSLDESVLRRVIETGRSESSVTSHDAALVELPAALAAVAIVADGSVIGALLVVRRPTRQFNPNEVDALEMLAPLVGSALVSVEAHGTATAEADMDALTELANRRCLDRDIEALKPAHSASYVMIDVDHFKTFNDANGLGAGDVALQSVARTIEANVRPQDRVYRYGGEEFCVLLPGALAADAAQVAERVRAGVESATIPGQESQPGGRVTISIGVADTTAGISGIIERADGALHTAKLSGRNQVSIAG